MAMAVAEVSTTHQKVEEWSTYVQEGSERYYLPRGALSVDECTVCFTGRSYNIKFLKTKSMPRGYKIWVIV
jgi:hypothetical protein